MLLFELAVNFKKLEVKVEVKREALKRLRLIIICILSL